MKRNPIDIALSVIAPENYDLSLGDIDTFIETYKYDHLFNLICSVFAYGFEMGARATAKGKYKPHQIQKMKQIRIQRGDYDRHGIEQREAVNQLLDMYNSMTKEKQEIFLDVMEMAIDRPDLQKFCIEYKGPVNDLPDILRQMT